MNSAKVIADSIGPTGHRITTLLLRYPRMVHAEFLRHRCFSYSVASSRAIPSQKLRQRVIEGPATIAWWGKNQAGMVAKEELAGDELKAVQDAWTRAMMWSIALSEALEQLGLHKQIANRPLEPWSDVEQLTTGTDWDNFEALRCHPDAQPEIKVIAELAREARAASRPRVLQAGEWHLPFITDEEREETRDMRAFCRRLGSPWPVTVFLDDPAVFLTRISAARCARTSYLNHEGRVEYVKDLDLYDRLSTAFPGHWSPSEHVCQAMAALSQRERWMARLCAFLMGGERGARLRDHHERFLLGSGNVVGFRQLRKFHAAENVGGPRP